MKVLDPRLYSTAVGVAIKAELGSKSNAYEYGEVPGADKNPGVLPNIYVMLAMEQANNPQLRSSATTTRTGWRAPLRFVGRTVAEAQWAMFRTAVALDQRRLLIDGVYTTRLRLESAVAPRLDDGRFSGEATYVFTH